MANLTQLKMLEDLDGFLLVDKPEGLAFSTVVKAVKRNFNLVKVGHGGSLDAMASGLLVLLLNDANKFVDRVMGADRAYTGTVKFGLKTNTGDIKGVPVPVLRRQECLRPGERARQDVLDVGAEAFLPPQDKINSILPQFKGDVFQTEPRFCSVRKEGSAEYEIADTGDHKQFLAHVYRLEVERKGGGGDECGGGDEGEEWSFTLSASKGLIPRALVDDFGDALGCGAALASLRRTRIGKFDVSEAVPFQKLLETDIRDFASLVQPISRAL